MHYPATMQPTHARWEPIIEAEDTTNDADEDGVKTKSETGSSVLPPIDSVYTKNFMIVDTIFEDPPYSHLGIPGAGNAGRDLGFNGLSGVSEDVLAELPAECRAAFDQAIAQERAWKSKWSTESVDAMRKAPIIDKAFSS